MDYDAFSSFHGVAFGLMEGTDGLLIVKTGSGGTISTWVLFWNSFGQQVATLLHSSSLPCRDEV